MVLGIMLTPLALSDTESEDVRGDGVEADPLLPGPFSKFSADCSAN
jgi:hypothetical protein